MTHDELVDRAGKWLRGTAGCTVVLLEPASTHATGEMPDAIGWKQSQSTLIECKVSRSDFFRDLKKIYRCQPELGLELGQRRYYLTPPGLLSLDEVPANWGLLEAGSVVRLRRKSIDRPHDQVRTFAEMSFVLAELRKVQMLQAGGRLWPTKRNTYGEDAVDWRRSYELVLERLKRSEELLKGRPALGQPMSTIRLLASREAAR